MRPGFYESSPGLCLSACIRTVGRRIRGLQIQCDFIEVQQAGPVLELEAGQMHEARIEHRTKLVLIYCKHTAQCPIIGIVLGQRLA